MIRQAFWLDSCRPSGHIGLPIGQAFPSDSPSDETAVHPASCGLCQPWTLPAVHPAGHSMLDGSEQLHGSRVCQSVATTLGLGFGVMVLGVFPPGMSAAVVTCSVGFKALTDLTSSKANAAAECRPRLAQHQTTKAQHQTTKARFCCSV